MAYWLIKSDPETYSFENLKVDKKTAWDGVRNYQARNNLMNMKNGDFVFFYHSQISKDIVGIAIVTKENFQDTTTDDERWVSVELSYFKELPNPISLPAIKSHPLLVNLGLIKQSRLSVMPLSDEESNLLLNMAGL
jgi:predicted RNA-binding protein with PUA-like domain